jgi:hypothetical protein
MDKFFIPSAALDDSFVTAREVACGAYTKPFSLYPSSYDYYRMGWWLCIPEKLRARLAAQLEAIEIFESFGEFPT